MAGIPPAMLFDDYNATGYRGLRMESKRMAEYVYRNATGEEVFRKVRYEPKRFVCYRQVNEYRVHSLDAGTYTTRNNIDYYPHKGAEPANHKDTPMYFDAAEPVPYNLPMIMDARRRAEPIIIVEGEKDADTLSECGFIATSGRAGASMAYPLAYGLHFRARRMVVIPDADAPGIQYALGSVGLCMAMGCESVRLVDLDSFASSREMQTHPKDITHLLDTLHPLATNDANRAARAQIIASRRATVAELVRAITAYAPTPTLPTSKGGAS